MRKDSLADLVSQLAVPIIHAIQRLHAGIPLGTTAFLPLDLCAVRGDYQ